jgi:hypothetical protein
VRLLQAVSDVLLEGVEARLHEAARGIHQLRTFEEGLHDSL